MVSTVGSGTRCIPCILSSLSLLVLVSGLVLIFLVPRDVTRVSIVDLNFSVAVFIILLGLVLVGLRLVSRPRTMPDRRASENWQADRRARTLRRVPFSMLAGRIDAARIEELERRYSMRPELAKALIGVELGEPEDILRNPQVMQVARPYELWQVLRDPRGSPRQEEVERAIESNTLVDKESGVFLGLRVAQSGRRRAFISDINGDILSAEVGDADTVDLASLRFGGLRLHEIANLEESRLWNLLLRIHSPVAVRAGLLWERKETFPAELRPGVDTLSQVLRVLQGLTHKAAKVASGDLSGGGSSITPGIGTGVTIPGTLPGDVTVDGCTGSPDFDVKDCCDAHDRCYAAGCTSCDRLDCDLAFFDCVISKGGIAHAPLAAIYYFFVRLLGSSHFNYCDGREPRDFSFQALLIAAIAVVGGVLGAYGGGVPGAIAGAVIGFFVGIVVSALIGAVLCEICDQAVEIDQAIKQWAEETRRLCRDSWKRCKRRRHWWQRVLCWFGAALLIIICYVLTVAVEIVIRVIAKVVQFVTCS